MTSVKFKVVIAGDGPFRETLERQAADLGLLSEIKFVGALADLTPIYGQADIFVLLSDWEGTPNVIMEAMASGLPVVASRVGGIPDLVVDGLSGFLVQLNNIEEIAGALVQLIKDPILRRKMGEKGQEIIENRYSKMALKSNLEQLYQLVMK